MKTSNNRIRLLAPSVAGVCHVVIQIFRHSSRLKSQLQLKLLLQIFGKNRSSKTIKSYKYLRILNTNLVKTLIHTEGHRKQAFWISL